MNITNSEIKFVRSLHEKKFRDENGLFVVEGDKMVAEAIASDFEVVNIYRTADVGETAMSRMSALNTPPPSLAVVKMPVMPAVPDPSDGLCLALDSVRDPGNLGTIIRLADWFGVGAIYASADTVEAFNPKTVQSTMGAIFRKKVIYCDLEALCHRFIDSGRAVMGTFMDGDNIYSAELPSDALVVMGNEARGISDAISKLVSAKIHIPSFTGGLPTAESLNVAIATAITVSEFRRRQV